MVSELKLIIRKEEIIEVESTILLGTAIYSSAIWEKHVEKSVTTSNLHVIKRLSSVAGLDVLYTAYYGSVYAYLAYGNALWGHSCKNIEEECLYCRKEQSQV